MSAPQPDELPGPDGQPGLSAPLIFNVTEN